MNPGEFWGHIWSLPNCQYGQFIDLETIDPVLAVASITVFAGVILMKIEFVRCTRNT